MPRLTSHRSRWAIQAATWVVSIGTLWVNLLGHASWAQEIYQVGVAREEITPSYPIRLSGFGGRRAESEGVGQPIWAKALAISQGQQAPIVLMTVDSLGLRLEMVDAVAQALEQSHQLPRENVILTFTHSHCTPKVNGACDTIFSTPIPAEHQQHINRYTEELTEHLVRVARQAIDTREDARMAWGVGQVEFAMNRRTPGGPVDHSLPVLVVRSLAGDVRAVYTTYACHCVTLSYNKIHGDWAGCAQEAIERAHPGAVALVSIGCGSDANPNSGVTGAGEAIATEQGGEIAAEVERLLEGDLQPLQGPPQATLQLIDLPLQTLPTREQLETLAAEQSPAGYNAAWQLERWQRDGRLLDHLDYPIQTLQLGDELAMVFLAGEVCVDYALRLRREFDSRKLWIHGYSNDFCAYIPSERLLREGGYGGGAEVVYFALPAMLETGLEEKIIAEVGRQLPADWRVDPGTQGVPPSEPDQSLRQFEIDPAFEVQLVASEPQIQDPVALEFGLDGRLWVVEMADYARGVDEDFQGTGRVKWLEDRDGDGFFEKAHVFIDGLRFPTDVKVWRDGVLICDAPDVLFCRDTDRDGRADESRKMLSGFATHNPHARVNSLRWGLDGWLYGSCGLFGGVVTTAEGLQVDLQGRDFRWKPETGELEPVSGTTQQGRDRDDWNHWFGCDNGTLLRYYPLEDRYLRRNSQVTPPPTQLAPLVGDNAGQLYPAGPLVLFKLSGQAGRPTSACGLGIYRDDYLGPEFATNSFTCEPVNQLVHRRQLQYVGTQLQARRAEGEATSEFLASTDRWFRPVQARTGPDGGLWIVDMYRYVIEHPRWIPEETRAELNVFAGQDRGRIFRVVRKDQPVAPWPRPSEMEDARLVELLQSRNGVVRDMVHQHLIWNDRRDLAPALNQVARQAASPAARGQALAVTAGLTAIDDATLLALLEDPDPHLRAWAIRCSESRLNGESVCQGVIDRLTDDQPMVREQALWSLGQSERPAAIAALIDAWPAAAADPVQRCAVLSGLGTSEASAAAWHDRILSSPPGKSDSVWLDSELLRVSFSGLSDANWSRLFQRRLTQVKPSEELFDEPCFQALVHAAPDDEPARVDKATLNDLRGLALQSLRSQSGLAPDGIACRLELLTNLPPHKPQAQATLLDLIDSQLDIAVQTAVVRRIASRLDDPPQWGNLLERLHDVTPTLQATAVDAWLARQAGRDWFEARCRENPELVRWLTAEQRGRWMELSDAPRQQSLQALLELPPTAGRAEVLAEYEEAATGVGSLPRGQRMFAQHCAACHRLGREGGTLGPDLGALGNKTPRSLMMSILDPSRDIDARYRNLVVETVDGLTLVGLLLEETGTTIRLQLDAEKQQTVLRTDVESLRTHPVSFMPEGLEKDLSVADMRDLLTYLMTTQQPPKQVPGNAPIVVQPSDSGELVMSASTAEIYGGDITFESPLQNIGMWHATHDFVVWRAELNQGGRYQVHLNFSCADASAGNPLVLAVADHQLKGQVPATGGWDRYQTWQLGTLELEPGPIRLSIEPQGPLNGALMDLKSVTLSPVSAGE